MDQPLRRHGFLSRRFRGFSARLDLASYLRRVFFKQDHQLNLFSELLLSFFSHLGTLTILLPSYTYLLLPVKQDFNMLNMPALSPTMESGTIAQWHKAPGDELSAGDVICDVETDKATVAFDIQDDGVLAKIISEPGSGEVQVGSPVAVIVEDTDAYEAFIKADAAGEVSLDLAAAAPAAPKAAETPAPVPEAPKVVPTSAPAPAPVADSPAPEAVAPPAPKAPPVAAPVVPAEATPMPAAAADKSGEL